MKLDSIKQHPKDLNQWIQMSLLIPHIKNDSLATTDATHYRNILEYKKRQARPISIVVLTPPTNQFLANQVRLSNLKITSSQESNANKFVPIPSTKADQHEEMDYSYEKPLKEAINFEQPIINYLNENISLENDLVQKKEYMPQLKIFSDNVKNVKLLYKKLSESSKLQKNRLGPKEKKIYKNNHPTKNFLASFKMAHIYYLQKSLGKDKVHSFSDINRLQKQNGITKKDFVDLYSIPQFEITFEKMFYTKQLFRNLMLSKSRIQHRKVHQKKLFNFEKAFKTKQFLRIE